MAVVGHDNSPIKIGLTNEKSPYQRLNSQQTGNPWPLQIITTMPGNEKEDKLLRERFKPYQCMGGGKDWYYPNKELLKLIRSLKKKGGK